MNLSPNQSLRILHLASSERWTGVAEPVTSLAAEQQRMGHQPYLACVPNRSFERCLHEYGVPFASGFYLNRRLNPLHLIADVIRLRSFCRRNQIDIVHCHLLHDHWLAAFSLRQLPWSDKRRPLLVRTIHRSDPLRTDYLHRRLLLKQSDAFICISADAARQAELDLGLAPQSVPFVKGGVNPERFNPCVAGQTIRAELGIPDDAPVAGIVARMREGRGFHWMMKALPRVLEVVPNAHILAVGRGELKHWFKNRIRIAPFCDRVHYAGYRRGDLPDAYAAMDVSMFLGLGSEGTCRAILEAMACGRPVIGTNVGAVPEIIEDRETGLLVENRKVDDLAKKLIEMLSDRTKCAEMGKAARRCIEEDFNESVRAKAVLDIYFKLLCK